MEPPQTFIKTWGPDGQVSERQLTNFPHPHPQLKDMSKEIIRWGQGTAGTACVDCLLPAARCLLPATALAATGKRCN